MRKLAFIHDIGTRAPERAIGGTTATGVEG